jgi:hypothetical protein
MELQDVPVEGDAAIVVAGMQEEAAREDFHGSAFEGVRRRKEAEAY